MATTRARTPRRIKPATKKTAAKKTTARKAGKVTKKAAGKTSAKRPAAKKTPARKASATKTAKTSKKAATKKVVHKPVPTSAAWQTPARHATASRTPPHQSPSEKTATATLREAAATQLAVSKTRIDKVVVKKTLPKAPSAAQAPARNHEVHGIGEPAGRLPDKSPKITPEQALANTRALLQAKQQHKRQPQRWQRLDPQHSHLPHEGFQSPEAAAKAEELHAGESRMDAIQGSIGTHDRHNQRKRDNR